MDDKQKPTTVEEYIGTFPEDVQRTLKELHSKIAAQLPDAEQVISYGIPTFKKNDKYVVYFAGYQHHISLYPIPRNPELRKDLEPYMEGKGTLRFPLDKPLPYDLIKRVVEGLEKDNSERTGY